MTDHKVVDIGYSCCLLLSWVVSEIAHVSCARYPSLNDILEKMNSQ